MKPAGYRKRLRGRCGKGLAKPDTHFHPPHRKCEREALAKWRRLPHKRERREAKREIREQEE